MKDLKPFTPAEKIECPKCLNGYMELKIYGIDEEEYIEVTCGACGYTWNMETADAGKKQVILEELVKPNPKAEKALENLGIIDVKDKEPVVGSKVKLVEEKSALTLLKENEETLKDGMAKMGDDVKEVMDEATIKEKERLDSIARKKAEDEDTKGSPVEEVK